MEYTNPEQKNNENLVNEYINVLAKKMNDQALEVVTLQARINLAIKEKEQLLGSLSKANADIAGLKNELKIEREKPPQVTEVIKEVEIVKTVLQDESLLKENEILKKDISHLENKIRNLKEKAT